MSRVCQLFSGSSGNSTYIGTSESGILVDAGVNAKRLTEGLDDIGITPEKIKAIFVTHEHIDHIRGVRVFASKHKTPVFATPGTLEVMDRDGHINGKFPVFSMEYEEIEINGFKVRNFQTSHDCAQSCGYTVTLPDSRSVAVCTDLGFVSGEVKHSVGGCDLVVFESNHDIDMLKNGAYPYYLKQRILGRIGHLSNENSANELPGFVERGTTRIILSHLSRENNRPLIAKNTAVAALSEYGMEAGRDYLISIAPPSNGELVVF